MKKNRVDIITLGCSKNLVDSESLMRMFLAAGYDAHHDSSNVCGEIVVVNTCGFIGPAKEESVNMILNMVKAKKNWIIGKLIVMGCLSERYRKELQEEIPEVDAFYGKFDWKNILEDLGKSYHHDLSNLRLTTTPPHYSFLKISEGCSQSCSYCAIPIITGKHRSKPMEEIIKEAKALRQKGTKELLVIAQDLTSYGLDLYNDFKLPELVERLSDIDGLEWIRLHYAYPRKLPRDLIRVMRERENICNYLDIALQHISNNMLKAMRRGISKEETYDLIYALREGVPKIHLRTTMMTGHPGETEADFEELLNFIKEIKFERLGAFMFSNEEGTYCDKHYKDDIPPTTKEDRLNRLMLTQEAISSEIAQDKIGKKMKVLIDRIEDDRLVGRTEYDSPEVDPEVYISQKAASKDVKVGEFINVKITDSDQFDLYGEII